MYCNCKWTETILAIIIIVFALWTTWIYSGWIVVIAAILLLIHAWSCKNCCANCKTKQMPKSSPKRSSGRRKRK